MRHDKHSIIKIGTSTDWYFACMPLEYFFQNIATICRKNCIKNIFYDFFVKKSNIYTNFSSLQLQFFYCFCYLIIEFISFQIHLYFLLLWLYEYIFLYTDFYKKKSLRDLRLTVISVFLYSIALIGDCAKTIIETYELFCSLERCDI